MSFPLLVLLTVFVGSLVALQGRINGQLATTIHNGIAGALFSNLVGFSFLWILVFAFKRERNGLRNVRHGLKTKRLKPWELTGGFAGGFFLAVQSITVPQIGVAIFTIGTIAGQTGTSLLIDKIGLSPSGKKHITLPRVITAGLTFFAVTIAVYPKLIESSFKLVPVLLCLIVGVVITFQQAFNARVNVISKRPLATAWINFSGGTFFLIVAFVINLLTGGKIDHIPTNPWLYLGGPIGLIFIASSAFVVKSLGVLNFIIFSVAGQLIGALLLDCLAPVAKDSVSGYLIFGTLMTFGAIAFARISEPPTKTTKTT
jgi:transporter family-2 protein